MNYELNSLEEQLLFEYECALEDLEENGMSEKLIGILFAYESLLSNLQLRDKKKYVKRKDSVFYDLGLD